MKNPRFLINLLKTTQRKPSFYYSWINWINRNTYFKIFRNIPCHSNLCAAFPIGFEMEGGKVIKKATNLFGG
jgi:hypothetical protein